MNHQANIQAVVLRWPALVTIGVVALVLGACSPREEKPVAPDGAAQQPAGPPPGAGRGMGQGMGRGPGMGPGPGGRGMGPAAMCAPGSGPLTDEVREAVLRALDDERQAEAAYAAVTAQLGPGTPFSRIERAEQRHAAALERLLAAHGVPIPAAEPAANPPKYADVAAACRAGVESEKANIAMYDGFSKIGLPEDVTCVFSHLRAASEERHLPAFQRCGGGP